MTYVTESTDVDTQPDVVMQVPQSSPPPPPVQGTRAGLVGGESGDLSPVSRVPETVYDQSVSI
jgi:hypothetical protein